MDNSKTILIQPRPILAIAHKSNQQNSLGHAKSAGSLISRMPQLKQMAGYNQHAIPLQLHSTFFTNIY
jgi:hypothetical protein